MNLFLANSGLMAVAIALEQRRAAFAIWRQHFLWLAPNYFGGASLAALLVVYTRGIDLTYLGIIVPLLLVMYLTFKSSMARVEDANIHLEQMNALYLSTIETLAMAVDAKDQITTDTSGESRPTRQASRVSWDFGTRTTFEP